jgi:mono/diheme cytochrome c family protein
MTVAFDPSERTPVWRFGVALAAVIAVLAAARWLTTPDAEERAFEFFPDMATSPALESQSLAPAFSDGLGQQPLVAGVVPRGRLPFRYGAGDEEAQRAGRELTNPYAPDDAAALARGAEVYRIHCVPCHDASGAGMGPAVMRGMLQPPPFAGANAMQMEDGRMFHVLTMGRGNMPAMSGRLDADDRWRAVLHVRALQSPPKDAAAPETAPPEEEPK